MDDYGTRVRLTDPIYSGPNLSQSSQYKVSLSLYELTKSNFSNLNLIGFPGSLDYNKSQVLPDFLGSVQPGPYLLLA